MRLLGVAAALLMGSSSAFAGDCATPYTIDTLLEDLTLVEVALREGNDSGASDAGSKLGAGLGCLDEVLPALIAARAYRAVGAGFYTKGEVDQANKWFLTSLEVDPTWEYGLQDIPDGHPMRPDFSALKSTPATDPSLLDGQLFKSDGEYYLNGRKITKPQARLDRFHVFQAQTATLATSVIDGNAFPETVLEAAPAAASGGSAKKPKKEKTPKEKTPKGSSKDPKAPKEKVAKAPKEKKVKQRKTKIITLPDGTQKEVQIRVKPPEKYPLIIGGGAIIASSGVLYYMAGRKASTMKGITGVFGGAHMQALNGSEPPDGAFTYCEPGVSVGTDGCFAKPADEAKKLRKAANQLVLASASVLAVGVGVTTWGVLVDGDRVMPTVRVRF